MAIITWVMVGREAYFELADTNFLTITLCSIVGYGGLVLSLTHMVYHCDNSEISSVSAFWIYCSLGLVVIMSIFNFFGSAPVSVALFIGLLVSGTICLSAEGFVKYRKAYA